MALGGPAWCQDLEVSSRDSSMVTSAWDLGVSLGTLPSLAQLSALASLLETSTSQPTRAPSEGRVCCLCGLSGPRSGQSLAMVLLSYGLKCSPLPTGKGPQFWGMDLRSPVTSVAPLTTPASALLPDGAARCTPDTVPFTGFTFAPSLFPLDLTHLWCHQHLRLSRSHLS